MQFDQQESHRTTIGELPLSVRIPASALLIGGYPHWAQTKGRTQVFCTSPTTAQQANEWSTASCNGAKAARLKTRCMCLTPRLTQQSDEARRPAASLHQLVCPKFRDLSCHLPPHFTRHTWIPETPVAKLESLTSSTPDSRLPCNHQPLRMLVTPESGCRHIDRSTHSTSLSGLSNACLRLDVRTPRHISDASASSLSLGMDLRNHHGPHGGHVFTSIGSAARPTRTTRSWTSNGVHYTFDTTSFATPNLSFGTMMGNANGLFQGFAAPARSPGRSTSTGGLLGGAFGMLEDLLSIQQPRQEHLAHRSGHNPTMGRRAQVQDFDSDTDEDLIYEGSDDRSTANTMMSRIKGLKDKLLDSKHKPREGREPARSRDHSHSRELSPVRRPRPERRQSSFRTEVREPQWSQGQRRPQSEYIEVDYSDDEDEPVNIGHQSRRTSQVDANMIEALENAVESERRAARACKKRLEQATREPGVSSYNLQKLVNQLKGHEDALTTAQLNLDSVRAKQRSSKMPPRTSTHQTRPKQSSRSLEEEFASPFGPGFDPLFPNNRSRYPTFQAFEEMERNAFDPFGRTGPFGLHEQLFEQMRAMDDNNFGFFPGNRPSAAAAREDPFTFFTTGGQPNTSRKRTRYSVPNSGPQFQQPMPSFTPFAVPQKQPPANLLKPEEAKRLFKSYNERWNALPANNSNIPYPARGLQANALAARDTIWAPQCNASVSTWSNETVLQANAQAFYLGVVGLSPRYSESPATGRVEMGFDKSQASPQQIKELVDLLKKERNRWHSDRLGRRNAGLAGPNEALQKDERARAVFHAICELMESAQ